MMNGNGKQTRESDKKIIPTNSEQFIIGLGAGTKSKKPIFSLNNGQAKKSERNSKSRQV
jgi:hypothetical protein